MKHLISVFVLSLFLAFSATAQAPAPKVATLTFKVYGNCDMCKERIEGAINELAGIKSASWSPETQLCTVVYRPKQIKEERLHQVVAAVGHDTEQVKATDKAYEALHGCCKYAREKGPVCTDHDHH